VNTRDEAIECCLIDDVIQCRLTHDYDVGRANQQAIPFNLQMELDPAGDLSSKMNSMPANILAPHIHVIAMPGKIFITSPLVIKKSALTCLHVDN